MSNMRLGLRQLEDIFSARLCTRCRTLVPRRWASGSVRREKKRRAKQEIEVEYQSEKGRPASRVYVWGQATTGALGVRGFLKPLGKSASVDRQFRPTRLRFMDNNDIETKPKKTISKYRQYSEKKLLTAYKDVKEKGFSVKKAARLYDVPITTLRDRVKGKVDPEHFGNETLFTMEEEQKLLEHLQMRVAKGCGMSNVYLQRLAGEMAYHLKKKTKSTPLSNTWLYAFIKRWSSQISSLKQSQLGTTGAERVELSQHQTGTQLKTTDIQPNATGKQPMTTSKQPKTTGIQPKTTDIQQKTTGTQPKTKKAKRSSKKSTSKPINTLIPKPSTSGIEDSYASISNRDSSTTDTDSEGDDNEKCCVCGSFSPSDLKKRSQILKFVSWVQCDRCEHWVHLSFCTEEKVVRRQSAFLCPHCR